MVMHALAGAQCSAYHPDADGLCEGYLRLMAARRG